MVQCGRRDRLRIIPQIAESTASAHQCRTTHPGLRRSMGKRETRIFGSCPDHAEGPLGVSLPGDMADQRPPLPLLGQRQYVVGKGPLARDLLWFAFGVYRPGEGSVLLDAETDRRVFGWGCG